MSEVIFAIFIFLFLLSTVALHSPSWLMGLCALRCLLRKKTREMLPHVLATPLRLLNERKFLFRLIGSKSGGGPLKCSTDLEYWKYTQCSQVHELIRLSNRRATTYLDKRVLSKFRTKDWEFIGDNDGLLQSRGVATAVESRYEWK